jgi:hypothetical protein
MEFTVVGDRGAVEYSSAGRPVTVYWSDGRKEPLSPEEKDGYQAEIEYFLECCRLGQAPAACPPRESAMSVRLTKLMVDARESRGEKLPCPF